VTYTVTKFQAFVSAFVQQSKHFHEHFQRIFQIEPRFVFRIDGTRTIYVLAEALRIPNRQFERFVGAIGLCREEALFGGI